MGGQNTINRCPDGMVFIDGGGAIHPGEPAYCISQTEITQVRDNAFWVQNPKTGYELFLTLVSGKTKQMFNVEEAPLQEEAERQIHTGEALRVRIQNNKKPQPKGDLKGDNKPAVYRSWNDAREFCQGMYKGGDIPTIGQWEKARGSEGFYSAYDSDGIYDVIGNVWQWLRSDSGDDFRYITGGLWDDYYSGILRTAIYGGGYPGDGGNYFGFRCATPAFEF